MKMILDGKRSNLGGKSLEKRAILYTSAKLDDTWIVRSYSGNNNDNDVFWRQSFKVRF